jgi:uncharacterized protein
LHRPLRWRNDQRVKLVTMSMIVVALAVSAACGSDDEPSETTTDVGIANPASVFCVEQGGTLEFVDDSDGQLAYCNLPDGTRIEEWEYYRSQNPTVTEP